MGVWEAALFGVVQGITEFLPISSTAHVTLAGILLGWQPKAAGAQWTAFLASIQLGSLAALVWYFWGELREMGKALWDTHSRHRRKLLCALIVGTLPLAALGLLLKPVIEGPWTKDPGLIAAALAGGALLMAAAEFRRGARQMAEIGWREAVLIGLGQAAALIPGSSRSGMTLAVGMLLGIERSAATQFAFLLGIPAIAASGALELRLLLQQGSPFSWYALAVSFGAAFLSSYAAIAWLLRYVRTHTLWLFILYRLGLAGAILLAMFHAP